MLQKIHRKILFIRKLVLIGADFNSRRILITKSLRNSFRHFPFPEQPFSCRVRVKNRSTLVYFTGTMGEIHTLVDIFADDNYVPKHRHTEVLFSDSIHTLLDLGANIGLASIWFVLNYPDIRIDAYEPNPEMFTLLKKNLSPFSNIHVFEEAISGAEGMITFNRSVHSLESSIFTARSSTILTVKSTSLNTAIKRIGGSVDLMKIDIEGAEFDAFKYCDYLSNVRAITGEAHTEQSGHAEEELYEILNSFDLVETYNPNHDTVFGFYAAHTKP